MGILIADYQSPKLAKSSSETSEHTKAEASEEDIQKFIETLLAKQIRENDYSSTSWYKINSQPVIREIEVRARGCWGMELRPLAYLCGVELVLGISSGILYTLKCDDWLTSKVRVGPISPEAIESLSDWYALREHGEEPDENGERHSMDSLWDFL